MINFQCKIANYVIDATAFYESTKKYCENYLTEDSADFSVILTQDDIAYEREVAAKEDQLEGIPVRKLSDAYLELTALQRKITQHLFDRNVILFHGSVVAVDGQAYLFTAKSGTGKSTHSALWRKVFGEKAVMVNDDKPFLEIRDGKIYAYGSPWNGKHKLGTNISLPLRSICILERGEQNQICSLQPQKAIPVLFQQSSRPANPAMLPKYLELLDGLTRGTSFYRLQCNMEPEAAIVAYEAMSGNQYGGA